MNAIKYITSVGYLFEMLSDNNLIAARAGSELGYIMRDNIAEICVSAARNSI